LSRLASQSPVTNQSAGVRKDRGGSARKSTRPDNGPGIGKYLSGSTSQRTRPNSGSGVGEYLGRNPGQSARTNQSAGVGERLIGNTRYRPVININKVGVKRNPELRGYLLVDYKASSHLKALVVRFSKVRP
jgi:hypothetical protein